MRLDGARVGDVLAAQVPAVGDGRYDLGCLYIGVNDVRALDWERESFERGPLRGRWRSWRSAATAC